MTEFIIIGVAALFAFSLFIGVLAIKEKRAATRPQIHICTNRAGCQCGNNRDRKAPPADAKPCRNKDQDAIRRVEG